jgi:epoxyqueuosine reductase
MTRAMTATATSITADTITAAVCRLGASAAGILPLETLLAVPSHDGRRHPNWPKWAETALVFGLHHPPGNLPLDYWGGKYGTLGNRRLIGIADRMADWLTTEYRVRVHGVPYPPDAGGIFLKEAAAAAGLGIIGRNNLLVSPLFGPHLRLRALLLDIPAGTPPPATGFDPCRGCSAPCRQQCPQNAFGDGQFNVDRCRRQMRQDQSWRMPSVSAGVGAAGRYLIRFCRACELSCPVGGRSR